MDELEAVRSAKEKLYGLRQSSEARTKANNIQQKHGSRKSGLPLSGRGQRKAPAKPEGQGDLF